MELYQERFKDLLVEGETNLETPKKYPRMSRTSFQQSSRPSLQPSPGFRRSSAGIQGETLKLRENPTTGTHLEGLTEKEVESSEDVCKIVRTASNVRSTNSTSMNKVRMLKDTGNCLND